MPVPRLFEAAADPSEQWSHLIATLLGLGGPGTRTALVHELAGEDLPGADALQVREQRPLPGGLRGDVVVRGAGWTLAVQATLAFDGPITDRLSQTHRALTEATKDRVIVVALTPDRRPSAGVQEAGNGGSTVRHRSWLRVRDWVQERPERGSVQDAGDLLLLREAEYFLTPRVAELYRLEGIMPSLPPALRPTLAAAFLDLNDLAPAPLIQTERDAARIAFPRTGAAAVEIVVREGELALRLGGDGEAETIAVDGPERYLDSRARVLRSARALLPDRL